MTTESKTPSLHSKIAAIQGQLERIPKSGLHQKPSYRYHTENDILGAVRPLCANFNISILSTCIKFELSRLPPKVDRNGEMESVGEQEAIATVKVTLTDGDSGETISAEMPGYASDKTGKALSQAITNATKYAVKQMFCLSFGDENASTDSERPTNLSSVPKSGNRGEISREEWLRKQQTSKQ